MNIPKESDRQYEELKIELAVCQIGGLFLAIYEEEQALEFVMARLQKDLPKHFQFPLQMTAPKVWFPIFFGESFERLGKQSNIFHVLGIDKLPEKSLEDFVKHLECNRERFKARPYSLVFWISSRVVKKICYNAPNFYHWVFGTYDFTDMEAPDEEVIFAFRKETKAVFLNNIEHYLKKQIWEYEHWEEVKQGKFLNEVASRANLNAYYVDLYATDQSGKSRSLDEMLDEFLTDEKCSFLTLLGDSGTGKSSFSLHYFMFQVKRYLLDKSRRIPFFMSLKDYPGRLNVEIFILKEFYEKLGLSLSLAIFQEFALQGRLLSFVDGFDEMVSMSDQEETIENFKELTKLSFENVQFMTQSHKERKQTNKIFMTCRTHYFFTDVQEENILKADYTVLYRNYATGSNYRITRINVEKFNQEQIRRYIVKNTGSEATAREFLGIIDNTYNLKELSERPLLLNMIVKTLSTLKDSKQLNVVDLYLAYTNDWIERDDWRSQMTPQGKRQFMWELAVKMYECGGDFSLHYSHLERPKKNLFKPQQSEKSEKGDYFKYEITTCSFLNRGSSGNYKFIHKSFMEYFVAEYLFNCIKEEKTDILAGNELNADIRFFLEMMKYNRKELIHLTANNKVTPIGNQNGLLVEKPINFWTRCMEANYKDFFIGLAKTAVSGVSFNFEKTISNALGTLGSLGFKEKPEQVAGLLILASLMQAVSDLIADNKELFVTLPDEEKIKSLNTKLEQALDQIELRIDVTFFKRPQDLPLLDKFKTPFVEWLQGLGLTNVQASRIHHHLRNKFVLALDKQLCTNPDDYACIEKHVVTPITQASETTVRWMHYAAWLQEQVDQRVFDEAFSLQQVYVPLRAYYEEECEGAETELSHYDIESNKKRVVVDLMTELTNWVNNFNKNDAVRVISGEPGCGKSSFAKIFAAQMINQNPSVPVLFIPIHMLRSSNDVVSSVEKFVKKTVSLTGSPLEEPRLLIIFDGLDELAMQWKTIEEPEREFINDIINTINFDNKQKLERQVLISGRDLAIQPYARKFSKPKQIMRVLPYYLSEKEREDYEDIDQRLKIDQRNIWWRSYGRATGQEYEKMPKKLRGEHWVEITRQPLLNYLVALGLGNNTLKISDKTTLNEIYADLFKAVYEREKKRAYSDIDKLEIDTFYQILEEIGLAIWHNAGRVTAIASIEKLCVRSELEHHLEVFGGNTKRGVTRLLITFFFRQDRQDGDETFEFTHKSFGEYLVARRLVRMLMRTHKKLLEENRQHSGDPEESWDEREALKQWAELCGPTSMDSDLLKLVQAEIALSSADDNNYAKCAEWQKTLSQLLTYAVRYGMPMHELSPIPDFQTATYYARNTEETLLALLYSCSKLTNTDSTSNLSKIKWISTAAFGNWIARLQGLRPGGEHMLALDCLSYLDLSVHTNQGEADHDGVNLEGVNLGGACLAGTNLEKANLIGAYLQGANLENANLRRANLVGANLVKASLANTNLEGATLVGANLKGAKKLDKKNLRGANIVGAIMPEGYSDT